MNSENKIYIHADDYGYTKSMSSKILDCVNDGKVNSISIMIDGNSEALTKIKGIKNTEIRLHLNLTSINSVGNQMHKEKLLKLSFLKLFFANKKLKKICIEEIDHQIDKFCKLYDLESLELDGHHHIQIIPWIYKHLTNQERYEITNIRIPSEKIYLLNFASILRITFYRNLFALIVLKYFSLGKKQSSKRGFAGLLYSGIYKINSLEKHIKKLKETYTEFEISFHPGHPDYDEYDLFKKNHLKYVTSINRINEYKLLQSDFKY